MPKVEGTFKPPSLRVTVTKTKRGLQGGITHSFNSYGEPITLSSLHMGLIPLVVMSFFKEGHVPSST
jgi:hypothetical protein